MTCPAKRWPGVPIYPDVRAVDARAPRVTLVAGGFPCKGASSAGKREGFGHPETVLWREMARAIRDLRPRYVLVENVADILGLHDGAVWGEVVGTLAALGYDVTWDCLPAGAVGAPHRRDRVFAVATYAESEHREAGSSSRAALGRAPSRGAGAAADTSGGGRDQGAEQPPGLPADREPEPARGRAAPADAEREPRELHRGARGVGAAVEAQGAAEGRDRPVEHAAARGAQDAPDASGGGQPERPQLDGERGAWIDGASRGHALRRGVAVEWGDYEPAIRRWEAIAGPAPEPLVRRVDDRRATRVVRSERRVERQRLSALGDGVQVQIGWLVGAYILDLEAQRVRAAA